MTGGRAEYRLTPFFYTPLTDQRTVEYRHDILRDLEHEATRQTVQAFGAGMRRMRERLAQASKLHYRYQQERWFAGAVDTYCQAVRSLTGELGRLDLGSRGFQGLTEYLTAYTASDAFTSLAARTQQLYRDLGTVSYSIHIKGNRVRVSKYDGEPDYSAQVEQTFAKFQPGAVQGLPGQLPGRARHEPRRGPHPGPGGPALPGRVRGTGRVHHPQSGLPGRRDRRFRPRGAILPGLPRVHCAAQAGRAAVLLPPGGHRSQGVSAAGSFDLALASKLVPARSPVVSNDFSLSGPERILVVTGPNNGGKTTFARMFGQLHYLASLGLPVPGRQAQLQLPDQVFTHFEREEDITTRHGKLADELTRIHQILRQAGPAACW